MAVLYFLLFPDGRFVPRWARLSALGWATYCLLRGLFPDMPLSLIDPFDVELIISITLVYGILMATLAGLFEITLVTVQNELLVFTRVEDSGLAYFATAMVMASLFEPLKRRIDAIVEGFFPQDGGDSKLPADKKGDGSGLRRDSMAYRR